MANTRSSASNSQRFGRVRAALFAGVLTLTPAGAFAQTQSAGDAAAPDAMAPTDINDIIVTARKVGESVQDVPIAITALSGDNLAERNIRSLDSLAATVPNFQFDTGAAISASTFATTAFIRGVGQNDYAVFTDPGIGLYVDGVYYARSIGAALDNFEIERVEVLRGPQGTLFGKNTIGGAVNVITKKPGVDFGGYVEGATGSFNKVFLQGALDLPVSDVLKTRLAAGYFKQGGYARRLIDGVRQGNKDNLLLRGIAEWAPSDRFKVTLSADYTNGKSNGAPLTLGGIQPTGLFLQLFNQLVAPSTGIVAPNGQRALNDSFVTGDPDTTYGTGNVRNKLKVYGASLTAELELGAATLRSITAYRYLETEFGRDGDSTPFSFRENALQYETSEQVSQEIQLTGRAFDDRLGWLAGGFLFDEQGFDRVDLIIANGLYRALEALPAPLPNGFGGRGNVRNVQLDNVLYDTNDLSNRTYALFANLTYDLTDWLTIEGGVRQNWDNKTFEPVHLRIASGVFIAPPGSRYAAKFKSFTPRLGVRAKVSDDINLYASYAKGFKSGGFNARPLVSVAEINAYEPETVTSYEIGAKTRLLDRKLVLNVAAFSSDYKNIQLPVNQPPQNFVFNAGAGRIRGIEAESTLVVGGVLSLNGSLGYLDAEYTNVGGGNIAPGQFIPITLASRFIKTPKLSWSAGAQLDMPLPSGAAFALRGDYAHKSGYFNDVANSPQIYQRPYELVNARLSFTLPDKRLVVALSGINLTNTRYLIAGNVAGAALGSLVEQSFSPPRQWEVSARFNF